MDRGLAAKLINMILGEEKLIERLSHFLERNGIDATVELISDAIDAIKPASEQGFFHRQIALGLMELK